MSINEWIIYIMVAAAIVGALDRIFGNRIGMGEKFEEGIMAIGALAVSMVGIIALSPVIANILKPVIVPVFKLFGADPSVFAGMILANDMGGAPLAQALAQDKMSGLFSGLIVGSMFGPTIVFTIPVALGIIKEEDRKFLASGVLAGIITIPLGAFIGGITAGFPVLMIIRNLIPVILIAVLIAIGLLKFENGMIKGFIWFGRFIVAVITIGLIAGIIESLTGIVVIPGMNPISEGFEIVAEISIVLAGAFPLVFIITKLFSKPLMKLGSLLKMNDVSAAGMIASLANSIPMFGMLKDMDDRGKLINIAFAVSAAFVFGDHLGFTAGYAPDMIFPMIAGKLVGGISAIFAAIFMMNRLIGNQEVKT
ncbi:MAG: ethanolamine utilization protein EutH [Clostridiales bacterium]|nr:ethanolamine utilization protein EutH [Clostridiales bacterium]MDY3746720.1 ethanolamine utilization protein EutH [Lachnospiraceae bacterium]